jgi:hypothetical protein
MIKSIGDVPYPIDTHSDAFSPLLTAGAALGITGEATDSAAWLQRTSTSDGPTTIRSIHGRTLRWNQLVSDSDTSVTVPSGHKYVARIDGTTTLATSDGTAITVTGGTDNVFDLTQMFGAGNEPTTVAEFEALYGDPYYAYDAGSLLPVQMEGIATEDADGNPLQSRTIPAGTLRGAGTVYDEQTETERITRIGEVDLGTLTWAYNAKGYMHTSELTPAAETVATQYAVPNATCVPYEMRGNIYVTNPSAAVDKTISINGGTEVRVRDSAYTDAAAFKTAMSGVMLHYALAEPTTVTIDPPLNLAYRTAQGGTERIMVPTGENSAPPTIVAAQGYTAESLRDAALSAIAPVENGLASTNYGVGSYLVHAGQLCKVTTAIATGEAITIGTNVVATTVMAEVLSLTQ